MELVRTRHQHGTDWRVYLDDNDWRLALALSKPAIRRQSVLGIPRPRIRSLCSCPAFRADFLVAATRVVRIGSCSCRRCSVCMCDHPFVGSWSMSALKTMTRGMLGFTVTSPISLLLLGLFGISGCGNSDGSSPLITNSSVLVVEPGQGIPNVCEIGMSFAEVEMAIGEGSLHGLHDRDSFWSLKRLTQEKFVLFPTLGVIGAPEQNGRLPLLTFYVQPYDSSITSPGLVVTNPFRGRIGDRKSVV